MTVECQVVVGVTSQGIEVSRLLTPQEHLQQEIHKLEVELNIGNARQRELDYQRGLPLPWKRRGEGNNGY